MRASHTSAGLIIGAESNFPPQRLVCIHKICSAVKFVPNGPSEILSAGCNSPLVHSQTVCSQFLGFSAVQRHNRDRRHRAERRTLRLYKRAGMIWKPVPNRGKEVYPRPHTGSFSFWNSREPAGRGFRSSKKSRAISRVDAFTEVHPEAGNAVQRYT